MSTVTPAIQATTCTGSTGAAANVVQNTIDWNHPAACHPIILDREKGLIDWHGRKKLAIVGFATSSMYSAPFDDPEWVILGLNQLYRHIPRADAWCDIHSNWADYAAMVEGTDHVKWCAEAPIPIIMIDRDPRLPTSIRFPIERLAAIAPDAPPWALDFFTSTISFEIAWAIDQGFTTIGLWGVDLIVGTEYFYQKDCASFWLGTANGLGINIVLPQETALLKHQYRYGYEREPRCWPIKMTSLERRMNGYRDEHQATLKKLYLMDGAIQVLEKFLASPDSLAEKGRAESQEQLKKFQAEHEVERKRLYTLDGAIQDCGYWQEFSTLVVRGGVVREE